MISNKTVLGIDISSRKIDMLWAGKEGGHIKVLKSLSEPLPKGIVVNGNIENVSKLAKIISRLKRKHKIQAGKTAVTLSISPMLTQLMYMPKPMPINPRKHFEGEVKKYAILPEDKAITLDFCRIPPNTRPNENRLLIVAAEHKKVAKFIKTFRKADIDPDILEPAILGSISSLYQPKVNGSTQTKSLFILLREGLFTTVVLRNGGIDLTNTKKPTAQQVSGSGFAEYTADQISNIQNYYDIELMEESQDWQITIVLDQKVEDTEKLKNKIGKNISYENLELINQYTGVDSIPFFKSDIPEEHLPPVAAGIVMKLLGFDRSGMKINLLPPEAANIREAKNQAILTATLAATIVLFMFLLVGMLNTTIKNINTETSKRNQKNTSKLLEQQQQLDEQISEISGLVENSKAIFEKHKDINWAAILNDIRNKIPSDVRVTSIRSGEDGKTLISGLALSNQSVGKFVDALGSSEHINSASLSETQKHSQNKKILRYSLNCEPEQRN